MTFQTAPLRLDHVSLEVGPGILVAGAGHHDPTMIGSDAGADTVAATPERVVGDHVEQGRDTAGDVVDPHPARIGAGVVVAGGPDRQDVAGAGLVRIERETELIARSGRSDVGDRVGW